MWPVGASGRGVLILSELAGAASELSEASLSNPTDTADVASSITRALAMPLYEQRQLALICSADCRNTM